MGISDCEGQRLLRDRKSEPVGPPRPDKVFILATVGATTGLGKWLIQEMSRVDILRLRHPKTRVHAQYRVPRG